MSANLEIQVENLDHLGLVAGIIDEIGIVEQINQLVGEQPGEIVSPGHAVKAMILNGLGLVSSPLYLFSKFFSGKATEHLIGEGIKPEHLNDDRLGRVLDKLYLTGLEQIFTYIALAATKKFKVSTDTVHLDSSSFSVHGEYPNTMPQISWMSGKNNSDDLTEELISERVVSQPISITYGYSRDHRPDLKHVNELSNDEMLSKYKEQQAAERGFAFLKDPLFFTDSVFLKSPERVSALALLMGLCLLVYTLAQRQLRQTLKQSQSCIKNQLGKLTDRPTLRWIFHGFQSIHLLIFNGGKQISNLSDERLGILRFFPEACRRYYLLS